jgi:hypothetical protein
MMRRAIHWQSEPVGDQLRSQLLFGAAYPFFIAAEALQRLIGRALADAETPKTFGRSVFAEARENATIAISYASMAGTTLERFARHARTERPL